MERLDIFKEDEGFYVGRKLKNGKMAAGSYLLKESDIVTMFAQVAHDFCKQNNTDRMLIPDPSGEHIMVFKVKNDEPKGVIR